LVFSPVVGRAIHQVVSLELERGSTLGRLEQLSGSMTAFGAISTQFMLKTFNVLGLALVALWV
jgi:hypothetical protein